MGSGSRTHPLQHHHSLATPPAPLYACVVLGYPPTVLREQHCFPFNGGEAWHSAAAGALEIQSFPVLKKDVGVVSEACLVPLASISPSLPAPPNETMTMCVCVFVT